MVRGKTVHLGLVGEGKATGQAALSMGKGCDADAASKKDEVAFHGPEVHVLLGSGHSMIELSVAMPSALRTSNW